MVPNAASNGNCATALMEGINASASTPHFHPRHIGVRSQVAREAAFYREQLHALAGEILLVEERERRRLSMDLHDGLSQTIVLIKLKLAALRRAGALSAAVLEIEKLADQANADARSISSELYPQALNHVGLEASVHELALHIGVRYGVTIVVEDDGRPKSTPAHTRSILFRSIRELFINAAKHARARQITVKLERGESCIKATVQDDGVGMRADSAEQGGFGLFSIRERLQHVGGSMHIESAPERGTKVCLRAPLTNERSTNTKAIQ